MSRLLIAARIDDGQVWSSCPSCQGLHPQSIDSAHVPPVCTHGGLLTQLGARVLLVPGVDDAELCVLGDHLLLEYFGFAVARSGMWWDHPTYGAGHGTPDGLSVARGLIALAERQLKQGAPKC